MAPFEIPSYVKVCIILIGSYVLINILYIGQTIILPIFYATLIAIILNPLVAFLERKKVNRIIAITIAIIAAIAFVAGLVLFISSQVSRFSETFPKLENKFNSISNQALQWISATFHVQTSSITQAIAKGKTNFIISEGTIIGGSLIAVLAAVFLLPVYTFMILYYQPLLLEFVRKLFGPSNQKEVGEVLLESRTVIQSYLIGLLIEGAIVATLNSVGLMILGIRYAILLGIIGALLNVIPYIGGIVAVALPMILALVDKPTLAAPILVLAVYLLIQFIDNHYLIPKIVASKVKLNALISLIVVFIGGALWGIPGMFLSIPMTAIFKVIFDHIEPLKPWGYLLGDVMPDSGRSVFKFYRKTLKK